jgi:hypothetical protein
MRPSTWRHTRAAATSRWRIWVAFNKRITSNGDVGIWHETCLIPDAGWEGVYNNMPPTGLGSATTLVPARGPQGDRRGPGRDPGRGLSSGGADKGDGGVSSVQTMRAPESMKVLARATSTATRLVDSIFLTHNDSGDGA